MYNMKNSKNAKTAKTYSELLSSSDLVNNPATRVPVCLCLDVSGSMHGKPIEELNEGVRRFYQAIREDDIALYAAEISIVTFGGDEPVCIRDFSGLEQQSAPPALRAFGRTPLAEAVNMSLDLLEKRKADYRAAGVDYYQPWLVLMTDGVPTSEADDVTAAAERTAGMVEQRKLTVIPMGVGDNADMGTLARFSPKYKPLKLRNMDFCEFFEWLGQSVSAVSQSMPGEAFELDWEALTVKNWAEL